MKTSNRRLLWLGITAIAGLLIAKPAFAVDKVVRIAHQKLEHACAAALHRRAGEAQGALGYKVTWTEFPAGPQLLEGLNVGGSTSATPASSPPVFAQAAGAPLLYVGNEPRSPTSEAILGAESSSINRSPDLKGKRVALNKGIERPLPSRRCALEQAGLQYGDITPVFLPPADARAAFVAGSIDAWVISGSVPRRGRSDRQRAHVEGRRGPSLPTTNSISPRKRSRRITSEAVVDDSRCRRRGRRAHQPQHPGGRRAVQPGRRHSRADPRKRR